ncbi:MAG: hypothetical protein IJD92_03995 [Bacilli bacterium]|nr:hypothetical protein [Bacilli bacterium]
MQVSKDELRKVKGNDEWFNKYGEGYRILYFYEDGHYYIGAYAKHIKSFMMNFCKQYPIMDESDIPEFVSIDDLLERYLESLKDITSVALYKTDGTCIQMKTRKELKNSKG